jgi:uncharacterized protein
VANAEIAVRLQPRASRAAVMGERGGRIVVRVTAPPVDGRANAALCALIAEHAGVPRGRVSVVQGQAARDKVVRVEGADAAAVRSALLRRSR